MSSSRADRHLPESLTTDADVVRVDPFGADGQLDEALAVGTTALFSDTLPTNHQQMTDLQWLQLGSAGYAQVSRKGLTERGITVTNASGVNDIPIAEWCVLTMLSLDSADSLKSLIISAPGPINGRPCSQRELRGSTLGIIGYGGIGRELARLTKAMGLRVWVMNRTAIGPTPNRFTPADTGDPHGVLPDQTFNVGDWAAFLPHLDYLAVTVALNHATCSLLGTKELSLLPRHTYLLNPARAHLVDEGALRAALYTGALGGAALDSHYREPITDDDPTWDLPHTIITPHISGSTLSPHYWTRIWQLMEENLHRFRVGSPLLNVVAAGDLR